MKKSVPATPGLFQIGAGNIFASMIISGLFIGYLIDQWLDKTPVFMLVFGVLGFVGGMKRVHDLLKYENTDKSKDSSNGNE